MFARLQRQSGNSPFRCGVPSKRKEKIALTRGRKKNIKTQKHPQKAQKHPQNTKQTCKKKSRLRAKKYRAETPRLLNSSSKKLIRLHHRKINKTCGSKTKNRYLRCSSVAPGWILPVLLRKTGKNARKAAFQSAFCGSGQIFRFPQKINSPPPGVNQKSNASQMALKQGNTGAHYRAPCSRSERSEASVAARGGGLSSKTGTRH